MTAIAALSALLTTTITMAKSASNSLGQEDKDIKELLSKVTLDIEGYQVDMKDLRVTETCSDEKINLMQNWLKRIGQIIEYLQQYRSSKGCFVKVWVCLCGSTESTEDAKRELQDYAAKLKEVFEDVKNQQRADTQPSHDARSAPFIQNITINTGHGADRDTKAQVDCTV